MTTSIPDKMRAVVCDTPGPVSVLQIKDVPVPMPESGQVLIKVLAFGINRAGMLYCYFVLLVFQAKKNAARNVYTAGTLSQC